MTDSYHVCDKGSKGYLVFDEFKQYVQILIADGLKRGNYEDPRPLTIDKSYRLALRINPSRDGVSMEEWDTFLYALGSKTMDLKTRDGI